MTRTAMCAIRSYSCALEQPSAFSGEDSWKHFLFPASTLLCWVLLFVLVDLFICIDWDSGSGWGGLCVCRADILVKNIIIALGTQNVKYQNRSVTPHYDFISIYFQKSYLLWPFEVNFLQIKSNPMSFEKKNMLKRKKRLSVFVFWFLLRF